MKASKKSFILLIGLGLTTPSLTACHKKIPQQEWVASVGDEKIWVSDLKDLLEREQDNYDPALWEDTEGFLALKKQILQGLIEQKLLVTEAKKKGVTISDKQVEEDLERLRSGYSQDEFEEMLKKQGTTPSIWKQSQQEKLLVDELLENEIFQKVTVTEDEIKDYYQSHRKSFYEPDRAHCQHIVANVEKKAKKILSLLKRGEPFATVAQQYSESPDQAKGGDLGFIKKGEYPPAFDACFSLDTGQMSPVIASEYGYHIFHLIEKKSGYAQTLAQAHKQITNILTENKGEGLFKSWLDDLFQQYKIKTREDVLQHIQVRQPPKKTGEEN